MVKLLLFGMVVGRTMRAILFVALLMVGCAGQEPVSNDPFEDIVFVGTQLGVQAQERYGLTTEYREHCLAQLKRKQPDPIEPACEFDPVEYAVGFTIQEATSGGLYLVDSTGMPQGYIVVCGGQMYFQPVD